MAATAAPKRSGRLEKFTTMPSATPKTTALAAVLASGSLVWTASSAIATPTPIRIGATQSSTRVGIFDRVKNSSTVGRSFAGPG